MASPSVNFRLPAEDLKKLDYLVDLSGYNTRSAFLLSWIRIEYDRINGNPQLMEVIHKARELNDLLTGLQGSVEKPMPAGMEADGSQYF